MPKPKECIMDDSHPFIKINEEYVFESTNDLKVKISYTATGESTTVKVSTNSVSYNYWAHSDYNIETLTDNYKSRIAIWLDESNIWYPKNDETTKFENLQCGGTYKLNIGYMLSDGTYITDSIYIQTWKFNIILTEIHSRYIVCELSSNYPGKYEWWSDQDSTHRITEDGLTKVNISEFIHHRNFITMYGQVLDMDDTRDMEEKIYVPLLYVNSEIDISGTSLSIKPNIDTDYVGNEIIWAVNIESLDIYKEYTLDDAIVCINGLEASKRYKLDIIIKYKSPEEGVLSDYTDTYEYYITTYGAHVIEELDKNINSFTLQLAETVGECYHPVEVFNNNSFTHKIYKAFVVKKSPNGTYDTSQYAGRVIIDQENETLQAINLERNTDYRIYIYLDDVKNFINHNDDTFIYYDIRTLDTVRCGEFEASITAKSCTITPNIERWNGSNKLYIKTEFYCEELNDIQIVNTELSLNNIYNIFIDTLKSGYNYKVTFEAYDDYNNEITINPLEITTYGLHIELEDDWIHTRYVDYIKFKFIEGMKSATEAQRMGLASSCRWWVSSDPNDSESIIFGPYDITLSVQNPFNYLMGKQESIFLPDKTYYIYTMINGISLNGINDSIVCYPIKMKNSIRNITYSSRVSGTTVAVNLDWEESNSKKYECNVRVDVYDDNIGIMATTIIQHPQELVFTKLTNGKKYRIVITGYDSENNTTSDYITINGNNIFYVETYKLLFSQVETSTRAIKWVTTSNIPLPSDSKIEYIIQQNNGIFADNWNQDDNVKINKISILDKVPHDTTVNIALRVDNIVDEDGNPDVISYSKGIRTRKLSIEVLDSILDGDKAKLYYSIYSNSTKINKDPITMSSVKVLPEESYASYFEGLSSYDTIYADNVTDEYVEFSNLLLDKKYFFTLTATDGHNLVFSYYTNNTPKHVIHIYDSTKHKYVRAIPYIFHNGRFVKSNAYIYHNNKWRETY